MAGTSKSGCGAETSAWELYNVDSDFSQANDLAVANPEKRRALQDLWLVEVAQRDVLPLAWLGPGIRFSTERAAPRSLLRDRMTVERKAK